MYYKEPFMLDDLVNGDDDLLLKIVMDAAQTGKPYKGYHGTYILKSYGRTDFILRCLPSVDGNKQYELAGVDFMANGRCIWDVRIAEPSLSSFEEDVMDKYITVSKPDGHGLVAVNVMSSDVIPSFRPGEMLKLQMNALAFDTVHFYKDRESYEENNKNPNGKDIFLANGSIFPSGLLSQDIEGIAKAASLICSEVTGFNDCTFRIGDEEPVKTSVICKGKTEYGDLDFVFPYDAVPENERENMRKGAIIYGAFFLVGDAGIFDYGEGIIRDEEHDLRAFMQASVAKDPERMREIIAENAVYRIDRGNVVIEGRDAIMS